MSEHVEDLDHPRNHAIPRQKLLSIPRTIQVFIDTRRAGCIKASEGGDAEIYLQAMLQLYQELVNEVDQCTQIMNRLRAPGGSAEAGARTALDEVREACRLLYESVHGSNLKGRLDALKQAGDRLQVAVEAVASKPLLEALAYPAPESRKPSSSSSVPRWDNVRRELWLGECMLKRYDRHPARNQVTVLEAFQARGWEAGIEDPFGDPEVAHQTCRDLNSTLHKYARKANLTGWTLQFKRDGTAEVILWEVVPITG